MASERTRKRVLAISSGGGHWVQLNRVIPAFAGHEVVFATVDAAYRDDLDGQRLYVVRDATRWSKVGFLVLALQVLWILIKERPDVVFSTGAAPGVPAIVLGRFFGARTIWLDSIANIESVSMSARMIRRHVGLWLTQWPHLASEGGPEYAGQVL